MSRVAHCIDNGPMEGLWGIPKRERYYGKRFTSKQELIAMIRSYIVYYNNRRVQRSLGGVDSNRKAQLGAGCIKAAGELSPPAVKIFILFHCPLDGMRFTFAAGRLFCLPQCCTSLLSFPAAKRTKYI